MDKEFRDLIQTKKKVNRTLVFNYKCTLEEELYDYCKSLGGHEWSDWHKVYYSLYFSDFDRWQETRHCHACGKYETREIPEEVERIKEETGTDISLD